MSHSNEQEERLRLITKSKDRKKLVKLAEKTKPVISEPPYSLEMCLKKGSGKTLEQLKKDQQNPNQAFFKDDKGRDCSNRKYILKEILEDEKQKAIQNHKNDMKKRLRNGGFPTSQSTLDFCLADPVLFSGGSPIYKLAEAQKQMREAFHKGNSIYAWGDVGNGKTSVSCRLAANWMKEDPTRQAYFISMATWFDDLFSNDELDRAFDIKKKELSNSKLVCLDDFDKIPMGEWANKKLFMLIDMFYSRGTQVIITSNRSLLELSNNPKANIDFEAVANRITGACGELGVIEFNHKSFR